MQSHRVNQISIPKFYENKNVLITGATGFLGRLLVEKLLRVCPGINKIYALVRPKKGKNVQDRLKDIIDIPLFDKLREENKTALDKIVLVEGNTEELGFGLNEEDKKTIIDNVTIIFHGAASIRFDEHLKKAVFINTRSAREAILLARQLKTVDVFVDISTAYCNCDHFMIEENLYPSKIDWRDLINLAENCDERTLEIMTQKFIQPLPNTYTFTKSVGEHAVADLAKDRIPAVIARPTIVIGSYSDPIPGWIDNFNGPAAFIYGLGRGVLRGSFMDRETKLDLVFVDNVAKALLIASWEKALAKTVDQVTVLNIATDIEVSLGEKFDSGISLLKKNPSSNYLWPGHHYSFSSIYTYYCFVLLYQFLPALLVDLALILTKRKPMLWRIQCKIYRMNVFLKPFMFNYWTFKNDNYKGLNKIILEEDVKDFFLVYFGPNATAEVKQKVLTIYFEGIRKYLANESLPTEATRKKQKRYLFVEKVWITFWAFVAWYIVFIKIHIIEVLVNATYNHITKTDA